MKTGHSRPFHAGIDPDLKGPGTNPGEAARLEGSWRRRRRGGVLAAEEATASRRGTTTSATFSPFSPVRRHLPLFSRFGSGLACVVFLDPLLAGGASHGGPGEERPDGGGRQPQVAFLVW